MEYNAENVMMGLRSCTRGRKSNDDRPCLECPYEECNIVGGTSERQTSGTCQGWLMKDALALLREKDAEVERLQGALKAEERHNELTMGMAKKALANARADTVRKMHSEIKERCIKGGIYPAFVASTIDQIAKEILEENE